MPSQRRDIATSPPPPPPPPRPTPRQLQPQPSASPAVASDHGGGEEGALDVKRLDITLPEVDRSIDHSADYSDTTALLDSQLPGVDDHSTDHSADPSADHSDTSTARLDITLPGAALLDVDDSDTTAAALVDAERSAAALSSRYDPPSSTPVEADPYSPLPPSGEAAASGRPFHQYIPPPESSSPARASHQYVPPASSPAKAYHYSLPEDYPERPYHYGVPESYPERPYHYGNPESYPERPYYYGVSESYPERPYPENDPPSSSLPARPYRFSDHIHRDRHIFLKGASVGIGCGVTDWVAGGAPGGYVSDWGGGGGGGGGGGLNSSWSGWCSSSVWGNAAGASGLPGGGRCWVDARGNVWQNNNNNEGGGGDHPDLGMALGRERLPALSCVRPGPSSSADWSKLRQPQQQRRRFPHLHPQHQPAATPTPHPARAVAAGEAARRRRFNEQLNTYVDTQKRIRSVQCVDDMAAVPPSPSFPYLASPPPAHKLRAPPPRPPALKMYSSSPRGGGLHAAAAPASSLPPPPALSRHLTSFNIKHPPPPPVPGLPLSTITAISSGGNTEDPYCSHHSTDDSNRSRHAGGSAGARQPRDPELELAEARRALQSARQASHHQTYADYFRAKEGGQGTFGRLFESYPKRVLTVCPAKPVRQRTEMLTRSRTKLLP